MRTQRAAALCGTVVAAMVTASFLVGPRLPEQMVTHWNAAGQPDGTMSKPGGQYLVPLLTLGTVAVLFVSPRIDPDQEHIAAFRPLYNDFVVLLTVFLAVTQGVVLAVNLGYDVPVSTVVYVGVGMLVFGTGSLLGRARQNWTVGIRTPWTLRDERVWDRTHAVGARLFKLAGLLAVAGAFVPAYGIVLVIVPLIGSSVALVAYSYYLYEQRPEGSGSAT